MNDFIRGLGETISAAASGVTDKTSEFFEITKIRGQIAAEEKAIDKIFASIGEILYEEYTKGTVVSETIAELCNGIDEHKEKISALDQELGQIRGGKE